MGQKTNAQIFRQGLFRKNWELKYFAKNNEESSLYLYKTLEIQKYLNRFFEQYNIKVHFCKIFYSNSSLHIFVSFYITTKTIHIFNKKAARDSTKWTRKKNQKLKHLFFKLKHQKKWLRQNKKRYERLFFKLRNRKNWLFNKSKQSWTFEIKEWQELLIQSLAMYTKNKINIFLTLQNLNHNKRLSRAQISNLKKIYKQLKRFSRRSFFKEAINIIFISISKRKSAKLLADYISDQFKLNQFKTYEVTISKKDNYFLGFLKQSIMLLMKSDISCLRGLKIVIKGRFNKAPRARVTIIQFGKFSLQSFNSKIDYYQSTAYTINGTFGVKVWLCENN